MGAAKRAMEFLPAAKPSMRNLERVIRAPVKFLKNPPGRSGQGTDRELVIVALTLAADPDPRAAAVLGRG